jgi:hypothetical protein
MYIVSIVWSIIEVYKIRKEKLEKRLDLEESRGQDRY